MKHTRNFWPIGIIAAFSLFLAGTVGLVVMACFQKVDLVSANYYEQEIRFQGQIDRVDRTRSLPVPAAVAYDAVRKRITIALPTDQARHEVTGTIQLYRPSAAGLDRQIVFKPDASGVQSVDAAALRAGLWKVRVSWSANNQDYFIDQKIVIGATPS